MESLIPSPTYDESDFYKGPLIVDGIKIPYCPQTPETFLDKSCVVVGPSNIGKTHLVKSILSSISKNIPVFLFSPTNTFGSEFLDDFLWIPAIPGWTKTLSVIENIQKKQLNAYSMSHNFGYLDKLLEFLDCKHIVADAIDKYNSQMQACSASIRHNYKKGFYKLISKILNSKSLHHKVSSLSHENQRIIKFIGKPKPGIILVFDDLGSFSNDPYYNNIGIRYRHLGFTMITITHYPTYLHPVIRNTCQILIICTIYIYNWYKDHGEITTGRFSSEYSAKIANLIYKHGKKRSFILFNREYPLDDSPFYYIKADAHIKKTLFSFTPQEKLFFNKHSLTIAEKAEAIFLLSMNGCLH